MTKTSGLGSGIGDDDGEMLDFAFNSERDLNLKECRWVLFLPAILFASVIVESPSLSESSIGDVSSGNFLQMYLKS